jgi:hypothetical protein
LTAGMKIERSNSDFASLRLVIRCVRRGPG